MLIEQVKNTVKARQLLKNGDKVLTCVSGGPDSMALLYLMRELQKDYKIKLAVAHLDHMLRGRQSAGDAAFVKKTAIGLSIPVITEKKDVKRIAGSRRMSAEEAAREVRYDFYRRAAKKTGANKIATGHNADDQAETVLMRFLKGSGSRGLSGIPYKRRLGDVWVIRPLLDVTRRDIENYLKKRKLPSRVDASNFKAIYLRNRLRHNLIPLLEKKFNPRIRENLKSIAKNLGDESDYLDAAAQKICKRLARKSKGTVGIGMQPLLRCHVALQRLVVRQVINSLKGDLKRIEYRHWGEIEALLSRKDSSIVDLPGGIKVRKDRGRLIFSKGRICQNPPHGLKKIAKLNIPGEATLPGLAVTVRAEIVASAPAFRKGEKKKRTEYINADSIRLPLRIRTRHKGDRIKPLGMTSFKKLHDVFVDEKIPRETRDRVPLILSGNRILWAAGVKLSEDCRVNKNTGRIVKLTVLRSAEK